jgi:PRTRC genetic system ThiF family protein
MKQKMHFTDNYILDPTHPVTVNLIGCGGTGSQVLTTLSRMSHTLIALGHPGLHLTTFDPDNVSEANLGRQLFSESDVGLNKAVLLTSRINRFFSTAWDAVPDLYKNEPANIIITCVDNIKSRIDIADNFLFGQNKERDYNRLIYWLDFGNTKNAGQVVLGSSGDIEQPQSKKYIPVAKLPCITERFDLTKIDEKDSGPSCSLTEAIKQQDLFINSTLANVGSKILWKLFRDGMTDQAGVFLNMDTMKMNPILL